MAVPKLTDELVRLRQDPGGKELEIMKNENGSLLPLGSLGGPQGNDARWPAEVTTSGRRGCWESG